MKCRVPEQEVGQTGLGEKLCKNSQVRKLNREDAVDHSRWRKLIKDVDQNRGEWVNVSSGTNSHG